MRIYHYQYKVKVEKEKAFRYFLKRDFLLKYFSAEERENVTIISDNLNEEVVEGEQIELLIDEDDVLIRLKFTVDEIRNNELIKYHLFFDSLEDDENTEDDLDDDFGSFMEKIMGQKIVYEISFNSDASYLIINEENSVIVISFWSKILWKFIGLYYRFKQRKVHKEIEKELEKC